MRVFVLKRRPFAVLACALAAAAMFWAVSHPAVVGASADRKQLPIYCVQRDQKMASLTFDAAWGMQKCGRCATRLSATALITKSEVKTQALITLS